jgi:signal transduction histidine kinase
MLKRHLVQAIDWFVPEELRSSTAVLWRARIFAISHLLGPWSAVVILTYLYRAEPNPGMPFWTIVVLCSAFWLLPFGMKLTRCLTYVAIFSICDLTFVSVFGSFFYGGVSSPFLPWFLTALLLGFFYLSERPLLVLGIFAVHLTGFCIAYAANGAFPELVPVAALSTVGVVSVCAATIYTSMMAVYYASVMTAQSELRQEIDRHLVTAAKMRKAKEEADRANEAKAVFLAKMSHQLRTPLTAIIGFCEVLTQGMDGELNRDQAQDIGEIHKSGLILLELVNDILDLTKIEAGMVELAVQEVDLPSVVDQVIGSMRHMAETKALKLTCDLSPAVRTVVGDPARVREVLTNLVSNAIKFTPAGSVAILGTPLGAMAEISVVDTGIGIEPTAHERIFEEFRQASDKISRTYGGTGLGLSIARKLVELQGGRMGLESEPAKGSRFWFTLPIGKRPVPLHAARS